MLKHIAGKAEAMVVYALIIINKAGGFPLFSPTPQTMVIKTIYVTRHAFRGNYTVNTSTGEYHTNSPSPTNIPNDPPLAALGIPADIYLIDEPSAYLDSEQRIIAARVIKRFIMHAKKTAFVVEHDFIMATYLADRVIVFDGQPSVDAKANTPESLLTGCNKFLKNLDVTFRRDPNSFRPRINKFNSQLDQEQKLNGNYFFLEDDS